MGKYHEATLHECVFGDFEVEEISEEKVKDIIVPRVRVSRFGEIYAPKTLVQLSGVLDLSDLRFAGGWRGQSNIGWKVNNGAVRRVELARARPKIPGLLKKLPSLEQRVREYEKRLLSGARMKGFGYVNGRNLSDLELLASLQHHGAATSLIDFTKNVFVALWFACQENSDKYGLLLGFYPELLPPHFELISDPKIVDFSIEEVIKSKKAIFVWEPVHLFDRMRVQQSLFLLSESHDGVWGSLVDSEFSTKDSAVFVAIAVSPELKEDMHFKWRTLLGVNTGSMFPDISGFSQYHNAKRFFEYDFFD